MAGEYLPSPEVKGPSSSPAGKASPGVRDPFTPDIFEAAYHWTKKRLPSPGAQNYAFETLALAQFTQIGAGVAQRHFFKVLQPPQLYIGGQALPVTGLGGVSAGQMIMQPLIDPYSKTYGGY